MTIYCQQWNRASTYFEKFCYPVLCAENTIVPLCIHILLSSVQTVFCLTYCPLSACLQLSASMFNSVGSPNSSKTAKLRHRNSNHGQVLQNIFKNRNLMKCRIYLQASSYNKISPIKMTYPTYLWHKRSLWCKHALQYHGALVQSETV